MVYPALFVAGEYRVPDPVHMPFTIVARSLSDFARKVKGTGIRLTPWLQDFSLGTPYGDAEVRQQVDAAASVGLTEGDWLLWSPRVRYHASALPRRDRGVPGALDRQDQARHARRRPHGGARLSRA